MDRIVLAVFVGCVMLAAGGILILLNRYMRNWVENGAIGSSVSNPSDAERALPGDGYPPDLSILARSRIGERLGKTHGDSSALAGPYLDRVQNPWTPDRPVAWIDGRGTPGPALYSPTIAGLGFVGPASAADRVAIRGTESSGSASELTPI